MIESLLKASQLCGFKIYDEKEYRRIISYELQHGQFKFLEHEIKTIGFFGWLIKDAEEGLYICINNLFVLPHYKEHFNIFDMCKFFKEKYPNAYKLEWHNQKKDCFKELILKGHTI